MICHKSDSNSINLAVDALLKEEIVILPTDTVYGFSGIVNNSYSTDKKIKEIKGRNETKPLIQLIASPDEISKYSDVVIPEKIKQYWPGPLTIILEDKRLAGKENPTTAFRCPGDLWLRNIIKACNAPIFSTSVNRSGSPVLDCEEDIVKEFSNEADLIILDGDKKNALPSTIIKIVADEVVVLRQGSIKL